MHHLVLWCWTEFREKKNCLCQSGVATDKEEYWLGWWQSPPGSTPPTGRLYQSLSKSRLPSVLLKTLPQPGQIKEQKVFLKPNLEREWVSDSVCRVHTHPFTFWAHKRTLYSDRLVLLEAGELAARLQSGFCDIAAPGLIITLHDRSHWVLV